MCLTQLPGDPQTTLKSMAELKHDLSLGPAQSNFCSHVQFARVPEIQKLILLKDANPRTTEQTFNEPGFFLFKFQQFYRSIGFSRGSSGATLVHGCPWPIFSEETILTCLIYVSARALAAVVSANSTR